MGRRKIRHNFQHPLFPDPYYLPPEDILVFVPKSKEEAEADKAWWKRNNKLNRPHLGEGSGRAGGARGATHYRFHVRKHGIFEGVSATECPICLFGLHAWTLQFGEGGDLTQAYWDMREYMENVYWPTVCSLKARRHREAIDIDPESDPYPP